MQYVYDLERAEPIIRDMPIYDSTNLDLGELLQLDGDLDFNYCVSAYNATAASTATDAVGVLNEETYQVTKHDGTSGTTPNVSLANGGQYGKVIINPGAVYRAEYELGTLAATSSGTTVTQAGLIANAGIQGGFCYANGNVNGELRYVTATGAGTATVKSAFSSDLASGDYADFIMKAGSQSFNLTSDAKKIDGTGDGLDAAAAATNLRVIASYIDRDNGIEVLSYDKHKSLNGLNSVKGGNGPKFYSDIVCRNHYARS